MPPGRPPKRPGEPEIDSSSDASGLGKCKLPRLDRERPPPNEFSNVVKSKLQSYTRTGQACDRCKVRKIRCDALPEGCSHCINQNLECYVTDRVTGRTERRGYMQELEREKSDMINHIRELEKLLHHHGVDVKPWHSTSFPASFPPDTTGADPATNSAQDSTAKEQWTQLGSSVWVKDRPSKMPIANISHTIVEPRPADAHLGVSADQAPLSSIKGTTLSILGSTIDIRSFDAPDVDEPPPGTQVRSPLYNKSIQALLQSGFNVNPPLHVELPPRTDAFTYAEWYFLIIHPFHPILHKPTFMESLVSLYDIPNYSPTVAETVMIHMAFASIYLQYGVRNQEQPEQGARLNELSNKHYHFATSKLFDLTSSRTLSDLQALTMICVHTMRFPKPEPSNLMATGALAMAVELGLHRAWKKPGEGTNLENELRKRIWWTILSTAVTLNGRMGKPMPIRLEEVDVDFPELIADELLTKDGVDTSRSMKCPYEIGVIGFKISTLFLEMYANIYCARRDPNKYLMVVEAIEEQLQIWQDNLPDGLKVGDIEKPENENQMFALYAEWMALELRLCLRHPSVTIENDPKLLATNTKICEETSKAMLKNVHKIYKLKSLDTTWYFLAVYVAAIFSDLVAHWERRHETTAAQVQALRSDMDIWLTVLAESGNMMGTGMGLRDAVSSIIDRTIAWIEHDRFPKANTSVVPPPPPPSQQHISQDMLKQSPHTPPYTNMPTGPNSNTSHTDPEIVNGPKTHVVPAPRNSYYSETTPDSATFPSLPYNSNPAPTSSGIHYDADNSFLYTQAAGQVAAVQAQAQAHAQAHAHAQVPAADHNALSTFAAQATQITQPEMMWRQQTSAGNTWQDWTAAIADSQDRYSANALMSLGGSTAAAAAGGPRSAGHVNDGTQATGDMGMGVGMNNAAVTTTAQMQWPLLLFSDRGHLETLG
ncbi:hypothetical protein F5X96DRAFT_475893 [Biscogniauxia mediterranea]|nr:hypothetical protein F5X96DRAFT_475893 [Biscogniauxia mediterranea]